MHRHRVDDHARLRPLDPVDLLGLALDGHVLVDYAKAAMLGHRDRHVGLGHGVHGRRNDGQIEADPALGQPR
jgi:hypothetical protein